MASVDLEYNQGFKIYNANGTRFNNLVLHKATYETVVMSLGDKISGIVYYKNNKLVVNMTEYIMYKNVKYVLVNPPTVIKEGLVSDNGELKGMTKYSFTFYHPMYMLSNFPFSDIAVSTDQQRYLSQNKTFSWIGNLTDYVAKLNKNLEGTQWKVSIGTNVADAEKNKLSEVLSFDDNTIADALKTAYETWEIPYIIDQTYEGSKRFLVRFGLPNNEIYEKDKNGNFVLDDNNQKIPFVFKYGQGVGLKNNSRTPKNNKIVTRIAGYGSEDNIPYGYPQIVWTGNQSWNYTINNDSTATNSYPIYDGIVGGQKVRLIKHPFTRTHLMPPIYKETVNKKVNPNATGYKPDIELVDYYDANDNTYPNQIKAGEPSYEIHEFEDIKPEFGSFSINSATPYDGHSDESITQNKFLSIVDDLYTETDVKAEKTQLNALRTSFVTQQQYSAKGTSGNYEYDWSFKTDGLYKKVKYASSGANFEYVVKVGLTPATIDWDDTMDEQGNYVQSYFKVTIPALGFDLYASAAITQEMTINMRSGACIGCSFPVMVDWDDYKRNFYDKDGNFAPTGTQRNLTKYPNSTNASITLILQKETNTFGTLMPNIYQKPASGDKFVILGISLPTSYITTAEGKLETEMKKYMRDNNVYYYEYPLKFDEHFLIRNEHILSQMKPNVIVNFEYADVEQSLYIKQMSIKYNESPLPKYDITLTDDVDVVLNKIGEAIAEYRGQRQYENGGGSSETLDGNKFLRKDINDTASGTIRMLKGLQVGERFVTGLLGEGGIFRKDDDGTTYLECDRMYVRMKAYFDTVEVRRFLHSGGNRIASAAGIKCSRVEYIASNGLATQNVSKAVKFRCYFRAQDNGVSITNDFVAGDQAYCKETNANLGQHGYWRLVIAKSSNPINGEHWIDLSASDCLSGSDIPIAQDDIIQLGNRTDKTRQGAIVEYVSGEDAPSYQIYQGINTYSLDNKNYIGLGYSSETNRAYMNVYGDMFVGVKPDAITGKSPTYIKYVQDDGTEQHNPKLIIKGIVEMLSPDDPEETTTLDDFAKAITGDIEYLQQQIDGEIDTWFYDGEPALNKYPASEWTTDTEKKEHLGDLYYDKLNGNAYRFIYDKDSETYSWLLLSDSAILEALRIANEAKDTADNKRRVFLTDAQHPHPTPPYDEGDLWVNAVWPSSGEHQGETYNDEILKCIKPVPREEGGSDVTEFSIGDWSAANGYKTALSDFINNTYTSFVTNIQTQVDRKAQTWYLSFDPSYSWAGNEKQHVGDLWYCTDDIENTDYKKNTTWIYQETINPETGITTYYWAKASVPDEVFDKIDRKAAIYVEWNAWLDYDEETERVIANNLQVRDLLIPAQDIQVNGVVYKQNKVYRCTNRNTQNPVFEEISYTDNSAFNGYINAILNGTGSSGDAATVAAAQKAIKDALGGGTTVDGGLLLTSLIAMRKYKGSGSTTDIANYTTWAGISGLRKDTETGSGWKGYGIAAWYGGAMVDHEVSTTDTDYAKSLFRFDGSGYLAGGNITWDKNGIVTIANVYANIGGTNTLLTGTLQTLTNLSNALPLSLQSGVTYLDPKYSFTNLSVLGKEVATKEFVSNNYVPLAFFNALFAAFSTASPTSSTTPINPSTWTASTVINNLKIKVGTWTEQYLSALGNNPNASGGGGISDLSAVLNELNSKDDLGTGVLVRNGLNNWSWMPYNAGSSGLDEGAMWAALGGTSDNKKIDNSHLSLKSLTFKAGASDTTGVAYSPTDNADKTITFDSVADSGISVARNGSTFTIGNTEISGLTPNTYRKVTVDKYGRVAAGENPTTLAGYGITDAKIEDGVITLGSNTITPLTDANIKNDYTWWGQKLQTTNGKTEVKGILSNATGIRLNNTGSSHGYIDFHYASNAACTSNIYEYASGTLQINSVLNVVKDGNVGVGTSSPSSTLHVTGTAPNIDTPIVNIVDNSIATQHRSIWAFSPNMSNGHWSELSVGKEKKAYHLGQLAYKHVDDNSQNNFISIGIYGVGAGLCVYGNRSVYIGGSIDTAPTYTLEVKGTAKATKFYLTDNLYFEVDGTSIKCNGDFYATGAVSALGSKSSGGQDYFDAQSMWEELGSYASKTIDNSHLSLSSLTITTKNGAITYNPTDSGQTIDLSSITGNYLPLTGNSSTTPITGNVYITGENRILYKINRAGNGENTGWAYAPMNILNNSGDTIFLIGLYGDNGQTGDSCDVHYMFIGNGAYNSTDNIRMSVDGKLVAKEYKVYNGTSSQFLKADGTLDGSTYIKSVSVSSGTNNGTIKLTIGETETDNIAVKGLKALAYKDSIGWGDITTGKPTSWWGQQANSSGVIDGKIKVNYTSSYSLNTGDNMEILSNYSDGIGWSVSLKNNYHKKDETGFGVGLKMALGGGTESNKYAGIAAVSESEYENSVGMAFYAGTASSISEKVRINASGNVGIGITSPSCKLDVNGTTNATEFRVGDNYITTHDTTNKYLKIISAKEDIRIGTGNNNNTLHINYGGVGTKERVVTDYQWHAGTPETWASFRMGDTQVTKLYLFKPNSDDTGAVYLKYESSGAGKGVHLVGDGFWVDGFVSALGSQSSGGGQDYFDAQRMWEELGNYNTKKIDNSHLDLYALGIKRPNGTTDTYNPARDYVEIDLSNLTGDYLPLTGGTLSGNVDLKYSSIDATKNGNNVTTTQYPTSFCIIDNGNRIITRTESVVEPESNSNGGRIGWYSYVRQYDSTHNTNSNCLAQRGIKYMLSKSLVGTWTVDDAPSFRTALGINLDNLVTTNTAQTITGVKTFNSAIGVVGGLTPIAPGNVNTVSGYGPLWIKRALRPEGSSQNDGTPNNGIVLEFGGGSWLGQLLMTDNGKDGLYWGGIFSGDRQEWKKIAFTDSVVSKATQLDDTTTRKFWGQAYWQNGKPVSADVAGALSGNGDITITKTANNIAVKLIGNTYQFGLHLGNGGVNRGIYDFTSNIDKWLLYFNASNTILNYGNVGIGTDSPSGKLHVLGSVPNNSTPICRLTDNSTISDARMIWALRPNMTAGKWAEISVGKSATSKNLGQLSYKHVADGSNNNFISLGIYGIGAGLAVYGNRSVYIGGAIDTAPTHKLYVNGSTYTTLVDFGNGITLQKVTENGVTSLKCTGNFYATGAVSALGSNTGGSGGGVVDLHKPLSSIYEQIQEDPTSNNSILVYSGGRWGYSVLDLSSYLTSASIKSLTIQGNGTSAVTFNPAGATSPTLNIKGGDGVTVTASSNTITIKGGGNFQSLTFKAGSSDVLSYTPSDAKTLTFAKDGDLSVISANNTITYSYTLPTATSSDKGGVKIGSNLSMNGDVLSVGSEVALLGTAQTFTANHKFNDQCWTLQGVETNGKDIIRNIQSNFNETKLYETNGSTLAYDTAITNAIEFMWYDHYWRIGNVRKDIDTYGFSIAHKEGNGPLYDVFRITKDGGFQSMGSSYNAGSLKVSGHVAINNPIEDDYNLYVDGNVRATQVSWFPSLELFGEGNEHIPYIDFHKGGSTTDDYTTRIAEYDTGILTVAAKAGTTGLVVGNEKADDYIKIGGAKLRWTGTALECDKDFYSTGAVSAFGSNTSGGGGGISDISVAASLRGTTLTIDVSGQTGSVDLSPISGTSGDYIPLSGSAEITGDLKPASNDKKDLGNSQGNRWRQIHGKDFIGETIELLEDKNEINFRTTVTDGFGCKVGYRTRGEEALVFANKNASTSFIFYTGQELTETESATWDYGTPAMQIKQNCVYINTLISNGVNPSYSLYVNGSGYFTGSLTTQGLTANEGSFAKLGIGGKDDDNIFYVNGTSNFVGNMSMLTDFHIKQYAPYTGAVAYQIGTDTSNRSVYAQGIWSGTFVSGGSDIRLKDVVCYPNLTIDDIAKAPIFNFTWKDRRDNTTHLGTSAQYWKEILPSVIYTLPDNYLTMEYQTTALAAAVFTARKVVDHELRIKQLEQENAILRKEIEELKAA